MPRTRAVALAAFLAFALRVAPATAAPGSADTDADRIAAQIAAVQRQADAAATSVSRLDQQYQALSADVDALTSRQKALRARLDGLTATMREVAVARYMTAAADTTTLLGLSLADPNTAAVGRYLSELSAGGGVEQIDDYRATSADLDATATTLENRQAQAQRQRDSVTAAQTALDQRLDTLRAALTAAQNNAAVQSALARQRQAASVQAASQARVVPAPAASGSGTSGPTPAGVLQPAALTTPTPVPRPSGVVGAGFVCPVIGPTAFGDTFGDIHQGIRHIGVDMLGHLDQEEVAVVPGTVRHTQSGLGGNQIWLYGDDGNRYFYAHVDKYGASGRVAAGTVIGYMGKTGDTGTIHLHFEVHPGGGAAVDPTPIVRAYC